MQKGLEAIGYPHRPENNCKLRVFGFQDFYVHNQCRKDHSWEQSSCNAKHIGACKFNSREAFRPYYKEYACNCYKKGSYAFLPNFLIQDKRRSKHYIKGGCILQQDSNRNTGNFQADKVKQHARDNKHSLKEKASFFFSSISGLKSFLWQLYS